jgi:thiamine-phosphate pyrophosphorylase
MEQARQLQQLCQTYKVPFIINDDLQLAISLGADGVHLGRDDGDCKSARLLLGAQKLIGVSCYNDLARAEQAVNEGADYIAFGAMFATSTKTNTVHASTDLITQAKQRYTVPLVAIGGITPENCEPVIAAGADLLAAVSSVYLASNPSDVVIKFNQQMVKYSS